MNTTRIHNRLVKICGAAFMAGALASSTVLGQVFRLPPAVPPVPPRTPVYAMADLVVSEITPLGPPLVRHDLTILIPITFNVANIGNGRAGTFKITAEVNGIPYQFIHIDPLPAFRADDQHAWVERLDARKQAPIRGLVRLPSYYLNWHYGRTVQLRIRADSHDADPPAIGERGRVFEWDETNNRSPALTVELPR